MSMRSALAMLVGLFALSACSSASTDPGKTTPSKHNETFGDDTPPGDADQKTIESGGSGGGPGNGAGGTGGFSSNTGGSSGSGAGGGIPTSPEPSACATWPDMGRSF